MANTLLTINMITREAVRLWKNSNAFVQHVDMQYDDSFARTGAKIGSSLRIRLPNDFTVRTGPVAQIQDTAEQSTTLVLATQKGVDVSFNSVDRTMSLDDFSRRILAPMVNNLAGAVAADVMSGVDTGGTNGAGICNYVQNGVAGAGGNYSAPIASPVAQTWLQAGAFLKQNSAPMGNWKFILDPVTEARTVASLAGLFNPQVKIGEQYRTGKMASDTLGGDWYMDQTVLQHTGGSYNGSTTVNGAGQSGLSITVNTNGSGTLAVGDIITFGTGSSSADVHMVNRITKAATNQLRQFVVTAAFVAGTSTTISVYPALIPASAGAQVQYQTVDNSPVNGGQINLVNPASTAYRKNFLFAPEGVTMATADLIMPTKGVEEAAREQFDGIAMRMLTTYIPGTDQLITRLDVLYGYLWVRSEWACVVADLI
jgi:P22 coat protein - gene protein 5